MELPPKRDIVIVVPDARERITCHSSFRIEKVEERIKRKYGFTTGVIELSGNFVDPDKTFGEEIESVIGERIGDLQFDDEKIRNRQGQEFIFTFVNGISTLGCATPASEIFLLRGILKYSKSRSGCRLSVYQLSEKCHGKIREGVTEDGIRYQDQSQHLIFQLVFKDEYQVEEFWISVEKIPLNYRGRIESAIYPELGVELEPIQKITNDYKLVLLTAKDYQRVPGEDDVSPELSMFSGSQFSAVELSDEVRLRLLEHEAFLYWKKPEKCHLISQSKYKDDKYNPNNIIYMRRDLHEYFDAINSTEGIPLFYLEYVSHDSTPTQGVVNGKPCAVYETSIKAVFKNEEVMSVISRSFKPHTVISNTEIQFILSFPNPLEFKLLISKEINGSLMMGWS